LHDSQPILQLGPKLQYRRVSRVQLKEHPNGALYGMALKNVQNVMFGALQEGIQPSERCGGKRIRRVRLVNVRERCPHPVGHTYQ